MKPLIFLAALFGATTAFAQYNGTAPAYGAGSEATFRDTDGNRGQVMDERITYPDGRTGTIIDDRIHNSDGTTSRIDDDGRIKTPQGDTYSIDE